MTELDHVTFYHMIGKRPVLEIRNAVLPIKDELYFPDILDVFCCIGKNGCVLS